MNARSTLLLFALIFFGTYNPDRALAAPPNSDTVTVIPGSRYEAGWLHRMIFGSHWRGLWVTPMKAPVLDLENFAGGLRPVQRGGGFQTKSLRLLGANGKEYKFRSIDKDPIKMVPPELKESIVGEVLQDQVSASNPVSAIIVAPILKEMGVLNAEPEIYVMPDDSARLKEFCPEFCGMLGTIEEHPDENDETGESFEGADKIVNTYNFFHKLEEDNDNQVDGPEYLKARLLDLFLGDWDRHTDQWRWAGYKQGKKTIWKPIPRDRDHAFSRQEGLVPWAETQILPQMNNFNEDYPRIWFLTWSGRVLDRKLLTAVSKAEWDSVTAFVQGKLTDSLINTAVQRMPPDMYAKEGARLEDMLKSRRDQLHEASEKFYSIYADFVDIEGSDKRDYAEINRLPGGKVDVSIYKRDKDSGEKKGSSFYHRIFDPDETQEVRIYLSGGDDMTMVKGDVDKSMIVRVIGGDGADEFADSSRVAHPGLFRSKLTCFYDSGKKSVFKTGPNTDTDQEEVPVPKDDIEKYEHRLRDYGQEWWYSIDNLRFNYTPDFGLFLGWGIRLEDYAFRTAPYAYRMGLQGGYAFGANKTEIEYEADIRSTVRGGRFLIKAKTTGLDLVKFYGFGNESRLAKNVDKAEYYESEQQRYQIETKLEYPAEGMLKFSVASALKYIDIDLEPGTFLNESKPYGISNKLLGSLSAGIQIDTRTGGTTALEGFFLQTQATYYPKIFQNDFDFAKLKAEARVYIPLPLKLSRIALKASAEKIWGTYPFFEAAYLGGVKSIRGYNQQRFAGDASVFGGAELRLYTTKIKFLVPIYCGPLIFGETGRVFLDGENTSDKWHTGVGGGLWFSFINPLYTLSISAAQSIGEDDMDKTLKLYLVAGFTF